jgi:hypothetical protein
MVRAMIKNWIELANTVVLHTSPACALHAMKTTGEHA